jgi:hypothetical protein
MDGPLLVLLAVTVDDVLGQNAEEIPLRAFAPRLDTPLPQT